MLRQSKDHDECGCASILIETGKSTRSHLEVASIFDSEVLLEDMVNNCISPDVLSELAALPLTFQVAAGGQRRLEMV